MRRYICLAKQSFQVKEREIRPVQDTDIEAIRLWRNAQINVLRQNRPITMEEQVAYYEQQIWPTMTQPQPENLLVAYLKERQLIGYGGLVHIQWEHRRAEVSFLVDPNRAGNDIIYHEDYLIFLMLLKQLAFNDLGFNRIFAETYAIRHTHIAVLEAAGFRFEGAMKQHVIINSQPVDSILHGCLRSYER